MVVKSVLGPSEGIFEIWPEVSTRTLSWVEFFLTIRLLSVKECSGDFHPGQDAASCLLGYLLAAASEAVFCIVCLHC